MFSDNMDKLPFNDNISICFIFGLLLYFDGRKEGATRATTASTTTTEPRKTAFVALKDDNKIGEETKKKICIASYFFQGKRKRKRGNIF